MLKWIANLFGFYSKEEYNELVDKYAKLQKENISLFTELKEQKTLYEALQKEVDEIRNKVTEVEKDKVSVSFISDNEIDKIMD
jgi:predicted nuclease with TOPRIM domain